MVKVNVLRTTTASTVLEVDCGWRKYAPPRLLKTVLTAEIQKTAEEEETRDNMLVLCDQRAIETFHNF